MTYDFGLLRKQLQVEMMDGQSARGLGMVETKKTLRLSRFEELMTWAKRVLKYIEESFKIFEPKDRWKSLVPHIESTLTTVEAHRGPHLSRYQAWR